ncbi:MAG: methylenetetrahydrofolate reductase [Halofilum sp. (in: g-proteobacteria)]
MKVSAEALGAKSAHNLFGAGVDEVLLPCIGRFDDAVAKAARIDGPVTVHTPANRIEDPAHAVECLHEHGIDSVLVVSGNPGHGRGTRTIYELIPYFRAHGLHVSVGAYPEDYFTKTSRAHRSKSASILVDKQAYGAERIITQASFSTGNMRKWLQAVRSRGVTLPIQVGVMASLPRRMVGRFIKATRAEIFTHPRAQLANKPNLDLVFRMMRSTMPRPERFIDAVAAMDEMGPEDGFHLFAYGTDVTSLVNAAHAARQVREGTATVAEDVSGP